jgi:hypothetical protein
VCEDEEEDDEEEVGADDDDEEEGVFEADNEDVCISSTSVYARSRG